jgi:hypothetical protein
MFHRLRLERKRWGAIAPKGGEKMGTLPLSPKRVCLVEEKRGTLKGGSQRATVSLVEKRPVNKGETNFPERVCQFCLVL